jgi:protein ImuB
MRHKKSLHIPSLPPQSASTDSPRGRTDQRVLVAWLPCFRLERCGWRADETVILVAEEKSALRIQAMTPVGFELGLRRGMTVSEARAIEPTVRIEHLEDAEEERFDLDALALLFEKLSPHIRPLPPSAVAVEIRGDEGEAIRTCLRLLADVGHSARVVVADEALGALALARWGDGHRVVPPGQLPQALAHLPLTALDPDPRLAEILQAMGIQYVGELAAIPAASVAGRFGKEGLRLHRIARGELVPEPLPPVPERGRMGFRRQLPEPVDQLDAVIFVLNDLAGRLQATLRARDMAAVRLQLRLVIEDAPDFILPVRLGQPRRLARDVMTVLRQRLKDLRLPGLVVEVEMQVLEHIGFTGRQQDLLDRGQKEPLEDLLGRLSDALGEGALYRPELQARHRPELEWTAAEFKLRTRPTELLAERHRPSLLLRELVPIRVEVSPRGQPQAAQIEGRWVPVKHREGPERLKGEWWEKESFDRDYWKCTLADGRCAWLFMRRQDHDWWLHGWFD